ncbi:G8 domain-containing protein [Thiocapsa marina 5811]|uniref:G8 domain-containing protein n=2 Tax=Thiocapsa marina TaxID=244573 RepID=F9UB79_9GAMM|nr:G8 domain-containing protein [Thiocapsa marina 5811]
MSDAAPPRETKRACGLEERPQDARRRPMMTRTRRSERIGILAGLILLGLFGPGHGQDAVAAVCTSGDLGPGEGEDLEVTGPCRVGPGIYRYRDVNIHSGGTLRFADSVVDFWARSILVENTGALIAGGPGAGERIGSQGGRLTIYLYGRDQGAAPFGHAMGGGGVGITCKTPVTPGVGPCGVPSDIWDGSDEQKRDLPGGVRDYFYRYHPLPYDGGTDAEGTAGFFGYKVLAVSYGGTLKLFGDKGASDDATMAPEDSGTSWVRLSTDPADTGDHGLDPGEDLVHLDRPVDWQVGDRLVVTTTDYMPGHSETLEIAQIIDARTIRVRNDCLDQDKPAPCVRHFHRGTLYDLGEASHPGISRLDLAIKVEGEPAADTRAAVALLSRSIRILSAGDALGEPFPDPSVLVDSTEQPGEQHPYYFGGHTIVRQGVEQVQVQGVEFGQLGQGGRMGHYPVHFHMARLLPDDSFVKDSSIHDSMTRWAVLHATQNLTLARNVGYRSIGHGYYLEEGTETDNRLYANIGISARAAVDNAENPRRVPGILASPELTPEIDQQPDYRGGEVFPYHSDFDHPSVFWIMNGWNDFQGNMAVGAGTCGACYWLVPGANSGMSQQMRWESYASMQSGIAKAGTTPLMRFRGNHCSTAMTSFQTVGDTTACLGVDGPRFPVSAPQKGAPIDVVLHSIPNPLAPARLLDLGKPLDNPAVPPTKNPIADDYYPLVDPGGQRFATTCDASATGAVVADPATGALDCSGVRKCANDNVETNCQVTVLDRYTSSFHWAETNFAAIWLRPQWYLVTDSVLTDTQNAGLTFVTGGDYTRSSAIRGHWMLLRKSALIGNTQPTKAQDPLHYNPYADHAGPFNPDGASCDNRIASNYCLSRDQGISMPLSNFGVMQRMFNIYDGPAQQESNAYLDITTTPLSGCSPNADPSIGGHSGCVDSGWMYGRTLGVPGSGSDCYLPNAAIGWKQPNGFYYPPAFHSNDLYFNNVDIRHFVIQPLFQPDTFKTDKTSARSAYCNWNDRMFDNFTDIDRQTVLNDDDGSMTGLADTISVNLDPFFSAPVEAVQCLSDGTAKTSPYQHVTSVIYPGCAANQTDIGRAEGDCNAQDWAKDCANQLCYGIPMYRQLITGSEAAANRPGAQIRMMQQSMWQRNNLTANKGLYYLDTTMDAGTQRAAGAANLNTFQPGADYYLFLVYAKPDTRQTYQIYVGQGADRADVEASVVMVRTGLESQLLAFQEGAWPQGWRKRYDPKDGTLTLELGMEFPEFEEAYRRAGADACQPESFCAWTGSSCGCSQSLLDSDPELYAECLGGASGQSEPICSWAGRDLDCPQGGCYGVRFTMPSTFHPDNLGGILQADGGHRPSPLCFRRSSDWDVDWKRADADLAGPECYNPKVVDPPDFCLGRTRRQ